MDFWPEFLASSWGREFVAGGVGGAAGVVAGYPLDTLRILQQQTKKGSAIDILRRFLDREGACSLCRGMGAPLASVAFQNAVAFQSYALLSRAFDRNLPPNDPPSYTGVALGGMGAGAVQSIIISPVELVKIHLQLQTKTHETSQSTTHRGPIHVARTIFKAEGWRGIYRGLTITTLRDAPAHGIYFLVYEYMRERLHPGCRKNGQETFNTMLLAGGVSGVVSWISCYPFDVIKTRIQAQTRSSQLKYSGIVDCFRKSVKEEGYKVMWRGLGTAVSRAFVVNAAIFAAYGTVLRFISYENDNSNDDNQAENAFVD